MARPWRLRHKLVLGLLLVVASVALLLGAAVFGLSSYFDTGRVTQRKLVEMQIVLQLRDQLHKMRAADDRPGPVEGTVLNADLRRVRDAVKQFNATLDGYKKTLQDQPAGDAPDHDYAAIDDMRKSAAGLGEAVDAAERAAGPRVIADPGVVAAYDKLDRSVIGLFGMLTTDVQRSHEKSEVNHRRTVVIMGAAAVTALVLVGTLAHYFRVWVFAPMTAIQAGVKRVRAGDFGQPIALSSGDELQELADEFNAMAAQVQQVRQGLESQVNERTRQLVRSERMVSVGFLAAGVAHEINNPLASIAFCADALERRLADVTHRVPADGEVVEKYLKMMQDEAQRCKQITQKLLDFSRSGGKRERSDLTRVVADVIEVARVLPNARNKRIDFRSDGALPASVSVPDIKGVVLNLVVNALDSMEEGGRLAVDLVPNGDAAELRFADTGCGMTPDTLENIFEPFFTRNRTGNGTGLGLSISHQIIDQHGGTITATSPGPGRGSTFVVRLPTAAGSEYSPGHAPYPEPDRPATVPFNAARPAA